MDGKSFFLDDRRDECLEQFQPLAGHRRFRKDETGDVASSSRGRQRPPAPMQDACVNRLVAVGCTA